MANNIFLKITPNKRDVVINTDVLINGYDSVTYPVSYVDTAKLGYVLDPDTFLFVDPSSYETDKVPYPVKIEVIPYFSELPFYGVNMQRSDNMIKIGNIDINKPFVTMSNGKEVYDEGSFKNKISGYNGKNGYYADFSIIVRVYWSDNTSHANDILNKEGYIYTTFGVNVIDIRITDVTNNEPGPSISYKKENYLTVADNFIESKIDAIKLKIEVTVTDPKSRAIMGTEIVTVKQDAYKGNKLGYMYVQFVDFTPLEIWSPTVNVLYTKSKDDEANTKVDKNSKTEYFLFYLSGSIDVSNGKYKYISEFYNGVRLSNEITADTVKNRDSKYINTFDSSIGYFKYESVKFGNYYTDNFNKENIPFILYDKTILSNNDYQTFEDRFEKCRGINLKNSNIQVPVDDNIDTAYYDNDLSIPKIGNEELKDPSIFNASGGYIAVYGKYYINTSNYYPISIDGKYSKEEKNYDILDSTESYTNDLENINSILNYKIITDESGNSVQYKHCINSLLDPGKVQVPRYAVYPILSGLVPILFSVYDYLLPDDMLPVVNSNHDILDPIISKDKNGIFTLDIKKIEKLKNSYDNLEINTDLLSKDINEYISNAHKANQRPTTYSLSNDNMIYGAAIQHTSATIKLDVPDSISPYLRINGINTSTLTNNVDPNIFIVSMDEYPYNISANIPININGTNGILSGNLLITNDENEKHLTDYTNKGYELNTVHHSSMLLRSNPKLSGNVKMVVDSDYKLYLDTFKANPELNQHQYRKYPISSDGNFPRDIRKVFGKMPANKLFAVPENSLKAHKVYHDFNDQYETMYEYGAETNTDNLYSENMKILAPLHIGNDVPEFFTIFRYDDELVDEIRTNDIDKFKTLIKDSQIVKTYDLRTHTSIGQYLNNYKDMLTNYGLCYLQFIELDYNLNSPYYRQGNNIWKGISVQRGILADLSETTYFGSKILNSSIGNKQEMFNNYIIAGFERHNLIYPNIINLEFMFNDNDMNEYSMHRYFGLYLTANDFINYGYIISNNQTTNNVLYKYDENGKLYVGDNNIYNMIFTDEYSDRLFYAITNDNVGRVKNDVDLNNFFAKYVTHTPESNLMAVDAENIVFSDSDKSFITMHFSKPMECGEHLKFIALDYTHKNMAYTNVGDKDNHKNNKIPYEHIVYEIIASNDLRLVNADNYINPYVETLKCRYSENTYFYRITFYSQDINYPEVTATIEDQIKRIISCINKFDTFIYVSSHNSNTLSVISSYDKMYLQHIAAPNLDDFKYDYFSLKSITDTLYTTNKKYQNSIDFMPHAGLLFTDIYNQNSINDEEWLDDDQDKIWFRYVESEDPDNIKDDNISYYNKNVKYKMHALTNLSDFYDSYYAAFSNYCFETLGWRYNTVIPFIKVKDFTYIYNVLNDITYLVNDIKYPLIYNNNNLYDTVNTFKILSGYLRNNILDPDIYTEYITEDQLFINEISELCVITSPFNSDYSMLSSINDSLLVNNQIHLYNPTSVSISVMGITNIKDIDTTVDLERTLHNETNLNINLTAGTSVKTDESDYRLQQGVMYEVVNGTLNINGIELVKGNKFIVNVNKTVYTDKGTVNNVFIITAKTNCIYKVADRQCYQKYNYDTKIPEIKTDHFYIDINNIRNSELQYPVVPLVNCLWKSNGQYYDHNNILDVENLNMDYGTIGHFTENVYTASDYAVNQYVTNKIDNILYVDGKYMTYKECILNKKLQHSIKKLLIDDTNIETAAAYYNSNILSLEFIFSGIRFNIKLNSKIVNSYIHLEDYNGFEAFVINDYDLSKKNELYISIEEKFILLVNHCFYIDYQYEAVSNVKYIGPNKFLGYADYAAFTAPYSINFAATSVAADGKALYAYKTDNFHKTLINAIDKFNLWSSLFALYDIPILDEDDNEPLFTLFMIESAIDTDEFLTVNKLPYGIGLYNGTDVSNISEDIKIKSTASEKHPYIITKADGDYNHQAYTLLLSIGELINNKITTFGFVDKKISLVTANNDFNRNITVNENKLDEHVNNKYNGLISKDNLQLSKILKSNSLSISCKSVTNDDKKLPIIRNIDINKNLITPLLKYIEKLIALESPKEKLLRYVKSFTDDVNIYIIPTDSEYKLIENTLDYNPLIFTLSVPNSIKYNYGWFTPNTNNMVDFYIDDKLSDILDVDLLQSNTRVKDIHTIRNYTGNKVYEDSNLLTLNKNYFMIDERSLLSSTWESNFYRLYTDENNYSYKEGYKTGIDDKSFFGSRCMVIKNEYITIDRWVYKTANDIYTVSYKDSGFNISDKNIRNTNISINLTSAIYNHFINSKSFVDNWNEFDDSQHTGIKNYINNTITAYYNVKSKIIVELYAINTNPDENINIINEKPANLSMYYKYENYFTNVETKNNLNVLTIILNETTGKNIYPVIKIYKR